MPRKLRLQLTPKIKDGPHDVMGGTLSIETRGAGLTAGVRDESKPAKITFFGRFIRRVLEGDQEERKLATLEGELSLSGKEAKPRFTGKLGEDGPEGLQLEPEIEGPDPVDTSKPRRRRRSLRLGFDASQFVDVAKKNGELRLLLPADTDTFRFLEFEALLEVDGAEEAGRPLNDVLDAFVTATAPPPLPLYDVVVVDDVGKPLPGVKLTLTHGGQDHELTTDDNGVVLLPVDDPGVAPLVIADIDALRDQLKERWDSPREGTRVDENDTTDVRFVVADDEISTLVDTETPFCISVQPYVFQVRATGTFFETNKTFLLPSALPGLREIRTIYEENSPGTLLIVGHTDTSGDAKTNDPLSLDRAKSMAAYLSDEVDPWIAMYGDGVPQHQRWGTHEDTLMITALPGFAPKNETPVQFYERTRFSGQKPSKTDMRKKLIQEYMDQDGANVKEAGLDIDIVTHGCGENFPLDETGESLDEKPADGKSDAQDRRVELFFFDKKLGVQPKVADGGSSKKGSKEYPEWRKRAQQLREVKAEGEPRNRHVSVILFSNSGCVPLANREVQLTVRGGGSVSGKTDAEGFFAHGPVPAGDHVLVIDGTETVIGATTFDVERRPHMVQGHVLVKATI